MPRPGHPAHVAWWPSYPAKSRPRTPCASARDGACQTTADAAPWRVASWAALTAELEARNLEVYVDDLEGWAFTAAALSDPRAQAVLDRRGHLRALVWRGTRRRFWVTRAEAWGRRATVSLCRDLEALAARTGLGQQPTPGRLGDALARRAHFLGDDPRRVSRPASICATLLLQTQVGGRSQCLAPGERHEVVYEIDRRSAYPAAWARRKPIGTAHAARDPDDPAEVTWVGPVVVTYPEALDCLGPIEVRGADGRLAYPTAAGTYRTTAWREQIADIRACGGTVTPDGWGWSWSAWSGPTPWLAEMERLRHAGGGLGGLAKTAAVAAIGRHGVHPGRFARVDGAGAAGDVAVGGPGAGTYRPTGSDPDALPHWHAYVLMQARRATWARAVAEAHAGARILALETDAIALDREPSGSVEAKADAAPGEWVLQVRRSVWWARLRWWVVGDDGSGDGTRMPGCPRGSRAVWLETHPPPLAAPAA